MELVTLLFLSLCCSFALSAENVTVDTDLGTITGALLESDGGDYFLAFRGIPYARPPIKNLRFNAPEPMGSWNGNLDATEDGANCIQMNLFTSLSLAFLEGDEDCLFLNVYIPQKVFNKIDVSLTEVMVFIHGGGFVSGSGSFQNYGPQRFMDKEIVLVTFNYRLGPFGFLSTGDDTALGNYGLLDQVMALKWVQKHIKSFGGNPEKVTIFGESAGSFSVSYHILSPLSKGLFHAAIQQSGSVLSEFAFDISGGNIVAKKMANLLSCPSTDVIKCLRKRPALDILSKSAQMFANTVKDKEIMLLFRPIVDNTRGEGAFLPKTPKELLLNGELNKVPVISGVNKDEGIISLLAMAPHFGGIKAESLSLLSNIYPLILPQLFKDQNINNRIIEILKNGYLKNTNSADEAQKYLDLIKLFTGEWLKAADDYNELLTNREFKIYAYKFSYRGAQSYITRSSEYVQLPNNFMNVYGIVSHADELQYLFFCSLFDSSELNKEDVQMSNEMLNLWINFAKTKEPTFDGFQWSPMKTNQPKYLSLNLNSEMVEGYLNEKWKLWNEIYKDNYLKTEL